MEYVINAKTDRLGLPSHVNHMPETYRVLITPVLSRSWAEVRCSCGAISRSKSATEAVNFLAVVYLAWLDGCGKPLYLAKDKHSITDGLFDEFLEQLPREPEHP